MDYRSITVVPIAMLITSVKYELWMDLVEEHWSIHLVGMGGSNPIPFGAKSWLFPHILPMATDTRLPSSSQT